MNGRDRYFEGIIKTLGFGAAFASIPIFASMRNLQPPWPEAVAYISGAVILIGALVARQLASEATRRTRARLLFAAAALTVLGLFGYLYLYLNVVVPYADGGRDIIGFTCNERGERLYPNCPHLTEEELADEEYQPARVFTRGSLIMAHLLLVAAWLLFTAGLVAAVGWAVAARGDDEEPQPEPAKPRRKTRKPPPANPPA
jgi:hypothetical protein